VAGLLVAGVKALDEKQQKMEEKLASAPAASCAARSPDKPRPRTAMLAGSGTSN
jgi:hypothetical protein